MNSVIKELRKNCTRGPEKYITYKNTVLVDYYLNAAEFIENFEVQEDDIWLCGFPKSGTNWSQEMIWNIVNDLNFEEAAKDHLNKRFPFFEYSTLLGTEAPLSKEKVSNELSLPVYFEKSLEYTRKMPSPRFIKTHLPFHLLPRELRTNEKEAKIIYIWRNPKDVCISFYHFERWMNWYSGSFADFCKLFLNDGVIYAPFWNHVNSYLSRRGEKNIFFLKYEAVKADLRSEIKRTANFLGKILTDDQISKLEIHLSFSSMSKNQILNYIDIAKCLKFRNDEKFFRKGEADQWKTEMSPELIEQFDTWIRETLKKNDSLLREL